MLNWLRQRRNHWWIWAPIPFAATLLFLAMVSWLFAIPGEICPSGAHSGDDQCERYNLAFGVIWKIIKILDASSVFLTAAATVGLGYITYLLVQLGKDQGRTSRAQLRPYVFIDTIGFTRQGDGLRLKFGAKNFSKATPAFNVTLHGHGIVSNTDSLWFYPIIGGPIGDVESIIGPETVTTFHATLPDVMSDELWPEFLAGTHHLHVWGIIKYQDIFGEEPPYTTQFRMVNLGGPNYAERGFQQAGNPHAT